MYGVSAYGDSTVDGHGTTPFAPNGQTTVALPNRYHNDDAPASWASLIDNSLAPSGVRVFNNGYGGRSVFDGWALANLKAAVVDNNTNIGLKFVLLDFGLNDVIIPGWTQGLFRERYTALIKAVRQAKLIPVVLTSDPVSNNGDRPTALIQEQLVPTQRLIAASNSCMLCDKNAALLSTWPEWNQNQPDGLHFNNTGHAKKADIIKSFITSNLQGALTPVSPWAGTMCAPNYPFG